MNIYLLENIENFRYDSFDAIVVVAESTNDAESINPYGDKFVEGEYSCWAKNILSIKCTKIGVAGKDQKRGVVLTSFNAG